jgi:hypothetical protein
VLSETKSNFDGRTGHLRATVRLNSRVPLGVEWNEAGEQHSEIGYTVDVSPKGCMAIVPQGFPVGQRLRLVNKVNGNSCDAILICKASKTISGELIFNSAVNGVAKTSFLPAAAESLIDIHESQKFIGLRLR